MSHLINALSDTRTAKIKLGFVMVSITYLLLFHTTHITCFRQGYVLKLHLYFYCTINRIDEKDRKEKRRKEECGKQK